MPPHMRLPSHVLRTNSTCVPSSTPSPADARKTVNGVHNPLTTRLKPIFTISFPLKNVSDRRNTMKPKTSTVSLSLPADENHLPNRSPNFAIPFAKCDVTRPFSSVLLWGYLTKKSYVPYTKPESPVITVTWKRLRLIFPNSVLRIHKNKNELLLMQPGWKIPVCQQSFESRWYCHIQYSPG